MEKLYIIWSEEHGAWWAPGEHGYTRHLAQAGRYSAKEAKVIVEAANRYATEIHEVAISDPL